MNIYQITSEQQRINELLEESGGELTPEIEKALIISEDNFLVKADSYAFSIRKYNTAANNIDEEIRRLQSLKKVALNTSERLSKSLTDAMIALNRPKLDLGTCKLSFRKSETVVIAERAELPEKYKKVKIEYDKTMLKADIKAGIEIHGVTITENKNLQIR